MLKFLKRPTLKLKLNNICDQTSTNRDPTVSLNQLCRTCRLNLSPTDRTCGWHGSTQACGPAEPATELRPDQQNQTQSCGWTNRTRHRAAAGPAEPDTELQLDQQNQPQSCSWTSRTRHRAAAGPAEPATELQLDQQNQTQSCSWAQIIKSYLLIFTGFSSKSQISKFFRVALLHQ